MQKIIMAESFKSFKSILPNNIDVKYVSVENVITTIEEEHYDGFILSKEFFDIIHLIRLTKGYQNTYIITFSEGDVCNTCSDINFDEQVTKQSFNKALMVMNNLLSPVHHAAIFNFFKKLIVAKDPDLISQLYRVPKIVSFIINKLIKENVYTELLTSSFIEETIYFSTFHDIGKLAIVNENLSFTGIFNEHQRKIMQLHTTLGAELLEAINNVIPFKGFEVARNIANYHHEYFNGQGYPTNLNKDEIPLEARIVAIADVYDALRSKRKYKEPFSHEKSFALLLENKGTQFDPNIISVIEKYEKELESIYDELF